MIYIDELIFLNFIIDYILIDFTSNILKINISVKRKILSCLSGEISILYLFINLNNLFLILFKIFVGIIMILIAFGFNDIKSFIKNILYFYTFSFLLGGTLYYFKIENLINYKYFLLLIPVIMNSYKKLTYNLKNILSTKYKVTIYLNNGSVLYLNGHMDTGNNLIDPITNKKVIIINKKINENYFFVPYRTIDNESLMKCFKPDYVYIDKVGNIDNVLIGLSPKKINIDGVDCLINKDILEGYNENIRNNKKFIKKR